MTAAQRFLDTKSALRAPKLRNSLLNSLLAGNLPGDGCDQHCVASQAVRISENFLLSWQKGPPTAGFSNCQKSPVAPFSNFLGENSQKSLAEFNKTPVFWRLALENAGINALHGDLAASMTQPTRI